MKAKITVKKVFLLVLSIVMLCCMATVIASAEESTCPHADSLPAYGWEISRETTCQKAGQAKQWCHECGAWAYKELPFDPNAHVAGLWQTVTPSSCTKTGVEELRCMYCDAFIEKREIPMHNYSVLYRTPATCMTTGYEVLACLTCYDLVTKPLPIDEDAHNYSEWVITKEATCVEKSGTKVRTCLYKNEKGEVCGHVDTEEYTDYDNHASVVWNESGTKPATCKAPGYIPGECTECKKVIKKEIPQHSQAGWIVLETVPATCFEEGSQTRRCDCGYEYTVTLEIDPKNHVYSDWQIRKEPGCTPGERYKYCKYHHADKSLEITQIIPATGEHRYGEWERPENFVPGCTSVGVEYKKCLDCDHTLSREIPPHHEYGTWTTISEMSCTEGYPGPQEGIKLAKCDKCNFEKYFTTPATHNFGAWKYIELAVCGDSSKPGKRQRTCSVCKKTETYTYYEEHTFTDWYVLSAPACGTNGDKTGLSRRWCTNCGFSEEKTLPVAHDFGEWEYIEYPSYDAATDKDIPGHRIAKCKYCDAIKEEKDFYCEHFCNDWTVTEEAVACEKDGKKVGTCVNCGKSVEETISAHTLGKWVFSNCSSIGETMTRTCACGAKSESKIMEKAHPNAKRVETPATCTTAGYVEEICPDCKNVTVGDYTPALGHKLDAHWTTKIEADCKTPGARYKACANCDYLEFQYVAKTDHLKLEIEPGVAPGCNTDGKSPKFYCAYCYEVFESEVLKAHGHEYAEGGETCIHCGAYEGSNDCVCACHSTKGMEKIFFEIIRKIYSFFGINKQCSCGVLHYEEVGFIGKLLGRS